MLITTLVYSLWTFLIIEVTSSAGICDYLVSQRQILEQRLQHAEHSISARSLAEQIKYLRSIYKLIQSRSC